MEIVSEAENGLPKLLVIQALDGLFDLYGDETREYDEPVFRQGQYLDQLVQSIPNIKNLVGGLSISNLKVSSRFHC